MSFRYCLIAATLLFFTACTTTPTTLPPPTPDLAATAENIAIRQTHVVATTTAIQLTLDAGASATPPPPTATEAALTEAPAEQPTVTTAPTLQPTTAPATLPPVSNPPTATTQPASAPVVKSFTVDKTQINGGDQITFTWETANATDITLVHAQPNGQLGVSGQANLPATGSVTITTEPDTINTHLFYLSLSGPNGAPISSDTIRIKFNCQFTWFFGSDPGYCAMQAPETKTAIEQPFEGGLMLWLPINNWHDIYSLYNDGSMSTTVDYWTSADPESDPTIVPPEGLYQPVRGFGLVWRGPYGEREKLGWAVAPEHSYSTTYQDEAGGTDWKGWNIFVRLADGRVIHVTGHYANYKWEYVTP